MKDLILAIAFSACLYIMGLVTGIYGFTSHNYTKGYEAGSRDTIERLNKRVQDELNEKSRDIETIIPSWCPEA